MHERLLKVSPWAHALSEYRRSPHSVISELTILIIKIESNQIMKTFVYFSKVCGEIGFWMCMWISWRYLYIFMDFCIHPSDQNHCRQGPHRQHRLRRRQGSAVAKATTAFKKKFHSKIILKINSEDCENEKKNWKKILKKKLKKKKFWKKIEKKNFEKKKNWKKK